MRQGPDYHMQGLCDDDFGHQVIPVPLEIVDDIADADFILWHDNGDGSFTLRAFDTLKNS